MYSRTPAYNVQVNHISPDNVSVLFENITLLIVYVVKVHVHADVGPNPEVGTA